MENNPNSQYPYNDQRNNNNYPQAMPYGQIPYNNYSQPKAQQQPQPIITYQLPQEIPYKYKPISAWGYFGYNLLFLIPLVGFIFLVVFSLGGTENINLRNYARSYFCIFVILFIIILILIFTGTLGGLIQNSR